MRKLHMFYHINLENNSAGGIISFIRGLVLELDKRMPLTYYTMRYPDCEDRHYRVEEVFLKRMHKNPNIKGRIPNNLVYLICVFWFMLRHRFGVNDILFFNRMDHTLPVVLFQRRARKVMIIHGSSRFDKEHFGKARLRRWFNKVSESMALRDFDDIILVSQDGYEFYVDQYPQYKKKIRFIPTYFNQSLFKQKESIEELEENVLRYLYFGRFVKQKGCVFFKEYFEKLNAEGVAFQATMIGEGELGELFEGIDNVTVIETVTQEALLAFLKEKVILLMFSRWEGMPLSLLEALSTGTPAITSDAGEMKYIIENGVNGYHFKDIPSSYDDILRVSRDINAAYWSYSQQSAVSVQRYSLENVAASYTDLLLKGDAYEG